MAKRVCVYGGKGALGSAIVQHFKASGWWTLCVDMAANDASDANVVVQASDSLTAQSDQVRSGVTAALSSGRLDSIVCVAGGWAGGNAGAAKFADSVDAMWKQSVWSSAIAASLAAAHLSEGGLLLLTGAVPSLGATPGMIGYGMAKAAVHQMVASLADDKSGLPKDATTLAILPVTLDTPMNRKWMASADMSKWTPLEFVAETALGWSTEKGKRPPNGSLVQLHTADGKTELVPKPFA